MDQIMELVFLSSGNLVRFLGLRLALVLVGFSPLYGYGGYLYFSKMKVKDSKIAFFFSIVLTLILLSVIMMTGVVMGTWG